MTEPRGAALRASLAVGVTDRGTLALIDEASRLADRLDELDRIIAGKGVLELMHFRVPHAFEGGDAVTIEVKFDNVLGEARQQANALRQILVTLGVSKAVAAVAESKGTPLDELQARRAARGPGAARHTGA